MARGEQLKGATQECALQVVCQVSRLFYPQTWAPKALVQRALHSVPGWASSGVKESVVPKDTPHGASAPF